MNFISEAQNVLARYFKPKIFLNSWATIVKATVDPNADETGSDMNSTIAPR